MQKIRFNSPALKSLGILKSENYVTELETEAAREACELTEASQPTIGFEVEVTASSIHQTAFNGNEEQAKSLANSLGFSTANDESYEISSAPSTHPRPLVVAIGGLTRAGLLPQEVTQGIVTEHVSIGGIPSNPYNVAIFQKIVDILRATEQVGGSTAQRLMQPACETTDNDQYTYNIAWNNKGVGGVLWGSLPDARTRWLGSGSRIELRSLAYLNELDQTFSFEAIYYLTRALFDTDHPAHTIYNEFSDQYNEHRLTTGQPLYWDSTNSYFNFWYAWENMDRRKFVKYMEPYAESISQGDPHTFALVRSTVLAIQKAYKLDAIASPFQTGQVPTHL